MYYFYINIYQCSYKSTTNSQGQSLSICKRGSIVTISYNCRHLSSSRISFILKKKMIQLKNLKKYVYLASMLYEIMQDRYTKSCSLVVGQCALETICVYSPST